VDRVEEYIYYIKKDKKKEYIVYAFIYVANMNDKEVRGGEECKVACLTFCSHPCR
jgi:hypothetical protein